jgi:cell division protein ZapA
MAVAVVTVSGRSFRVGCEDGQEARIQELGGLVDAKITQLRASFGEIGDQRLQVMAALEFADEASDSRAKMEALEKSLAELKTRSEERAARDAATEARLIAQIETMSQRLERLARELSRGAAEADAPL